MAPPPTAPQATLPHPAADPPWTGTPLPLREAEPAVFAGSALRRRAVTAAAAILAAALIGACVLVADGLRPRPVGAGALVPAAVARPAGHARAT